MGSRALAVHSSRPHCQSFSSISIEKLFKEQTLAIWLSSGIDRTSPCIHWQLTTAGDTSAHQA